MPDRDIVFNRMFERDAGRIDWHAAACRDADPEAFFPVGDGQYASSQVKAAKAVCALPAGRSVPQLGTHRRDRRGSLGRSHRAGAAKAAPGHALS
ncbi:hypothetical protein GCM10023321_58880 [Pseudonocardia eucalypti]|uniref:4Fe-4S Wbl-type domain-containing protein n=1 Tax=Pseudonocardia eucalypti TaxID=648755 RepID=A0ABP9QT46_9PSEU